MTRQERRARERQQRRQVILDAARELAEAEGWESVTTRRLADRIEYSQPVLYSHFEGKDAIVSAVALEGFSELSAILRDARKRAGSPDVDLWCPDSDAQSPPHAAFVEVRDALAPLAGDRDLETFTEITWSALHGLVTLSRAGRLRPDYYDQRLAMIVDQLGTPAD